MKPQEVEKLLGGYATGTLTPEERHALFQAAVDNQELFDALADEEALRELLADPAARRRLLSRIESPSAGWTQRLRGWMWRPLPLAAAAGLAAVAVTVVIVQQQPLEPEQQEIAMAQLEQQPSAPPPPLTPPAETKPSGAARRVSRADEPASQIQPEPQKEQVAAAAPPAREKAEAARGFRFHLERKDAEGDYSGVDLQDLRAGHAVRLVVEAREAGVLVVSLTPPEGQPPRTLFAGPVTPGGRYFVPPQGELPAEAGEKILRISFTQGVAMTGQLVQGYRARTEAAESADELRKLRDVQPRPAAAPTPAEPPGDSITIRLNYRAPE